MPFPVPRSPSLLNLQNPNNTGNYQEKQEGRIPEKVDVDHLRVYPPQVLPLNSDVFVTIWKYIFEMHFGLIWRIFLFLPGLWCSCMKPKTCKASCTIGLWPQHSFPWKKWILYTKKFLIKQENHANYVKPLSAGLSKVCWTPSPGSLGKGIIFPGQTYIHFDFFIPGRTLMICLLNCVIKMTLEYYRLFCEISFDSPTLHSWKWCTGWFCSGYGSWPEENVKSFF